MPFGNASGNVNLHHLPDHYDNCVPYGMPQYNTFHPPPANFELGVSSIPRMPPLPVNFGTTLSYRNYLVHGGVSQEYGRSHFMDGVACSSNRKATESLPGNSFLYSDASTSTSTTFMGPIETRQPIEVWLRDGSASYRLSQYEEGDGPIASDERSSRNVRVRSGVSGVGSAHCAHNYGYTLTHGSYSSSQSCRQGIPFWFDQLWSSNSSDGGVLGWSPPTHVMSLMHASNINGMPIEFGSQGAQGILEANGNRSFSSSLHFPFFNEEHFNVPYLSPPVRGN